MPDPEDKRIITAAFRRLIDDLISQQHSPFHAPPLHELAGQIVDDPESRPIVVELIANCLRVVLEDNLSWQDDKSK
ncbi:hypothetical protein [Mycobacterium conspicuum]|uniref:hypothetical protein n=1 Tax=Mycobacterium conspicuum TaxID=44010 RepID=UPI000A1596F4|nr:hypothetical protein [Mycobacterium conspicuum]ORV39201.1 hypothetical protein AWC00_19040 [Mycobacterium conspicuum]